MLVPGLDHQPLEGLVNLDDLPIKSKAENFSSTYQTMSARKRSTEGNFKRYGYGRIFKTVNLSCRKYVFTGAEADSHRVSRHPRKYLHRQA